MQNRLKHETDDARFLLYGKLAADELVEKLQHELASIEVSQTIYLSFGRVRATPEFVQGITPSLCHVNGPYQERYAMPRS